MKIWFRIVIYPSIIFFPDIFTTITLIHKQIIAMAGYYACGAFIYLYINFLQHLVYVEVLWPGQPNGVMSSAVSSPNHTFTGTGFKWLTSIAHILSQETDNFPS